MKFLDIQFEVTVEQLGKNILLSGRNVRLDF